ncbi:MAG: non-canonical purine NTP pyrophosphatase [Candidatus Paceibacterota bacterium]|jgi:non-canonical purine NTP pyrophosphatase (RdgB/HAM1 family)
MSLYFITGNKNKLEEVKAILGGVEQLDIDLPEIQDLDAKNIIKAKLAEAMKHKKGELIVEDTSLYMECLNGLPGPFIKWFLKSIGNDGLARLADKLGNDKAEAKTIIGYVGREGNIHFFEGSIKGKIIAPKGETSFGWDPIFQPDGFDKSFAEMGKEEKNKVSMRRIALDELKGFLQDGGKG